MVAKKSKFTERKQSQKLHALLLDNTRRITRPQTHD